MVRDEFLLLIVLLDSWQAGDKTFESEKGRALQKRGPWCLGKEILLSCKLRKLTLPVRISFRENDMT